MKSYILLILILLLANHTNLYSKNKLKDYYKIIAQTENKIAMLCLAEAMQDTTIELPDCKLNKVFIGYKLKILKTYIDNINLADSIYSKDSIITLSFIQTRRMGIDFSNPIFDSYNDFEYNMHLNEPFIIAIGYHPYYRHLNFGNKVIGHYINKNPGKKLYEYLEKKYKKTYRKKK